MGDANREFYGRYLQAYTTVRSGTPLPANYMMVPDDLALSVAVALAAHDGANGSEPKSLTQFVAMLDGLTV